MRHMEGFVRTHLFVIHCMICVFNVFMVYRVSLINDCDGILCFKVLVNFVVVLEQRVHFIQSQNDFVLWVAAEVILLHRKKRSPHQ